MSLQRMFEPGVAAISSGAARPDGTGSVVFNSPDLLWRANQPGSAVQRFPDPPNAGDSLSGPADRLASMQDVGTDAIHAVSEHAPQGGDLVDSVTVARTASADTAGGVVQAVGAPASGAAATAAGGALPTDLDELARRLFDPLSARLKAELWLDRERAGFAIDLRR